MQHDECSELSNQEHGWESQTDGVGQGLDLSDEEQLALIEALFERIEKLSPEDPAQGFDWKAKPLYRSPSPNFACRGSAEQVRNVLLNATAR